MNNNLKNSSIGTLDGEDRKTIKDALVELDQSMTRAQAEKDLQKEIVDKVFEKVPSVPKKLLKRLAKTYYNRSFNMDVQDNKNFEHTYEDIVG